MSVSVLAMALSLAPAPIPEPPPVTSSAKPTVLNNLPKWEYRRVGLLGGLVLTSGIGLSGAIVVAAMARRDTECWITCLVGAPMIAFGATGTAILAPWFHHHIRWDDPRLRQSRPDFTGPRAATLRRRQLWTAFGISGGVAAAGLTTWVTPAFVPSCRPFYNGGCTAAAFTGAAVLALGSAGMVSTGMALLLHRIHRHRAVDVEPGVAGLSVRF